MRKILIPLLALTTVLAVGCQKEESKRPPIDEAQKHPVDVVKQYRGLVMKLQPVINNDTLSLGISLNNTSNDTIPFNTENGNLFQVTVQDAEGNQLLNQNVVETERDQIQPKENVTWNETYPLSQESTQFTIKVNVLLKNKTNETYTPSELTASVSIKGNRELFTFLPNEKKTYTYENVSNQGDETETFNYFEKNYVQSNSTLNGTNVYMQDKTGLYTVYSNDFNTITTNIIDEIQPNKKMLLPLPATVGATWNADGITYEITSVDDTVQVPYGTLNNLITVQLSNGTKMYYKVGIGLVEISANDQPVIALKNIN